MSLAVAPGSTKGVLIKLVSGFAPSRLITGGIVSCTITLKVLVALLPADVAVTVTVFVPSENVEPEAGVFVVATTPPARFVADVLKFTTAPEALVASTVIFAGTVIIGGGKIVLFVNTESVLAL